MTPQQTELLAHTLDPETLQERLQRPDRVAAWLEEALRRPEPADPTAARVHHEHIGVAARVLRRLDVAEEHLRIALRLAERHGPEPSAVLARCRLAHVLQWQGRLDEAINEFDRCIEDGRRLPELAEHYHFVFHHAGKAHFDAGNWDQARELLAVALRLRLDLADQGGVGEDEVPADELVEASRLALDTADACGTAADVDTEVRRLVNGITERVSERRDALFAEHRVSRHGDVLVGLRTLLLSGPVHTDLVSALFPEHAGLDVALAELAADGMLRTSGDHLEATDAALVLFRALLDLIDDVARSVWGEPSELASDLDDLVCCATGTSPGPTFDAWVAASPATGVAGRVFDRLCALAVHRADALADVLVAEGLTAAQLRALLPDDPVRRRIDAASGRITSRVYRPLDVERRVRITDALRGLPS
ncbi:Tetratricopeptide repeat-containing protein [Streptoalloteichus tenebrarius]|uniref:Tetratricopeptide repeat-containing protein n=1 Tax=Streptoalloteichus tenebrarius (strain ATCC 17920 / DSM 40477 / JCM 4838 / CBS 697.72 / NBRC 16177 / NCIMB 11028 / NRRL B-12390 / A12253. 1 / ISP 5477) TaxID=1933 RepID=A0ABT1HR78_STRSD|nr:tetratricopeptide repeat protein [Streptoalloteichus tenebrarius]MCP2258017.1 Tetratricopeptide repeat-containing protein [Streptoalloteichus tenebrarius]BFF01685.1 hypothetical protein GCM10020241_33600 [Streptoalloteichus tenebrarius]